MDQDMNTGFAKAIDILFLAKQNNVEVVLNEGQLQLRIADDKNIDTDLLKNIKDNKQLLIDYLNNSNWKSDIGSAGYNKVNKFDRELIKHIPLSFGQERLWFIDKLEGSTHYHFSDIFKLKGKINTSALQYAFQTIINRHEVFRTIILEEDGKPWQSIKPKDSWQLEAIDGAQYLDDEKSLKQYLDLLIKKPFNLSKDDMICVNLIMLNDEEHVLVIIVHHIASDKWSKSIFINELTELYQSKIEDRASQLKFLELQYADYAFWQRNSLQHEYLEKQINYWKNKLAGISPLQLPLDYPRTSIQSSKGTRISFNIDKNLTQQLQKLSKQQGTTLFMTLLAAIKVLLYKYSGQEDISVGTSIADRHQDELESLIGFFLNTLTLRTEVKDNATFIELLQQVKLTTLEAYEHQQVPFEKVVEAVMNERDLSRNSLFQVMVEYTGSSNTPTLQLGNAIVQKVESSSHTSKFDITIFITETAVDLNVMIDYNADVFNSHTIKRMEGHFRELLSSIIKEPHKKISGLQMLTIKEEQQLLVEFNDTLFPYPEKNVVQLFEEQVIKTPEAIALISEHAQITYQELNERANQLARYLQSKGIKKEILVPICIGRSMEMIVGVLAILKSGGAYVPIDPEYPKDRISYMIEDTSAKIILSNKKNTLKLTAKDGYEIIEIDTSLANIAEHSAENLQTNIRLYQLAYIIYTSGSTGKPKGVMIEHRSLLNYLVNNKTKYIKDEESEAGTFIHLSYTFDASVTSMFMPLISGKSIVIASNHAVNIFEQNILQKNAPYNFIKVTPSHLELLQANICNADNEYLTGRLVIGGEALFLSHFDYLIQKGINIEVINEYGPTEATIGCTTYSFNTLGDNKNIQDRILIGKPIDNVQLHILDSNQGLVAIGVFGEICISGYGLARGYLNQPQLTSEKFIMHTFYNDVETRIYKTGDIGRWLPDGNLEYLGRKDDQVKIRGYRIELGEIESVLQQSDLVSQGVVLSKEDSNGTKRLVGYVVPNGSFNREDILSYLKDKLPDYMIPDQWIELSNMPVTSNGKIDRKALLNHNALEDTGGKYIAPHNYLESKLVTIWQELLEVEQVGIYDNFFQLGGHSLLAIQLISIIRKELQIELALKDVFQFSTVIDLGKYIEIQTSSYPKENDLNEFELLSI